MSCSMRSFGRMSNGVVAALPSDAFSDEKTTFVLAGSCFAISCNTKCNHTRFVRGV